MEMSTNWQGIEVEPSETVAGALEARRSLFRASEGLSADVVGIVTWPFGNITT
jgi:hypothetical protein